MGLVSWLIAIPFLTMLVIVAVPARNWRIIRWIAAAGCGSHLILTSAVTYLYCRAMTGDL